MTDIDMNVKNYSLSELMAIVELQDLKYEDIIENTNYYIRKYKNKNPYLSSFFKEIQSQLLQYNESLNEYHSDDEDEDDEDKIIVEGFGNMSNEATYPSGDNQVNEWYQNQNLTQSDENQSSKITDRKQKIQVFGNDKVPMNQEQIATTDTFNLPVKQDSLNPNLKNTITRFINLDSQFRQYTTGYSSQSTNYTCNLSDTIKNALKLTLYSYQIPFSWYTIDTAYGNTCLWINDINSGNIVTVSVPSGNYSQSQFVTQLNTSFTQAGFTFPPRTGYPSPPYPTPTLPANSPAYYNSNSGKITLYLQNGVYNNNIDTSFNITENTLIVFYDFTGILQCNINCNSKGNHYYNNTLGWIMGYRLPYVNVDISGNEAPSILDLNGTKYLIIAIDDYNQNHVNNSLISITQLSNNLKLPNYYSSDLPSECLTSQQLGNNLFGLLNDDQLNTNNGLLIASRYKQEYTDTQVVVPSAPRTITNAQIYTINSINANNNNNTNYLAKAPTTSDVFAIIPIKTSVGNQTGSLLVEFSGSLQDSNRTYFGPVNIDRMGIKLLDDKGNLLNLNGNDWCFSLIAECLYQY
jgi:hypothetical protein